MRTLFQRALVLVSLAFVIVPPTASADTVSRAEMRAEVRFFYDDLSSHGRWVDHRVYGIVWVPAFTGPDWQPYAYGRWVWTADYGWYWDSEEEFGWATYHYGRWVLTADYGWVWIPDDVWGPGWVEWRYSDRHVGWAPMPPEWKWRNNTLVTARIDMTGPAFDRTWVFVDENNFAQGEIRSARLARAEVRLRLNAGVRVTNYGSVNGRVYNHGVDIVKLRASTRLPLPAAKVKVTSNLDAGLSARQAGSIIVYRPNPAVAGKVDLDLELPVRGDAQIESTLPTRKFDVPADNVFDVEPQVGARSRIETQPVPDVGFGGNLGIGGGLRRGGGLLP